MSRHLSQSALIWMRRESRERSPDLAGARSKSSAVGRGDGSLL